MNPWTEEKIKYRLWNPEIFILFSFFFTFMPASVMYALNFRGSGNRKRFLRIVLASTILMVLVFVLDLPFAGINIGYGVFMRNSQSKMFRKHIESGGLRSGTAFPALLSILSGFIITLLWLIMKISGIQS